MLYSRGRVKQKDSERQRYSRQIRIQTESINSNEDKTLMNIYVYQIMQ